MRSAFPSWELTRELACVLGIGAVGFLLPVSVSASVITTTGCANVDVSCTLDELVSGGTITVQDKLFGDWEIEVDPGTVDYTLIVVDGLFDGALDPGPGIKFSGNGELSVFGFDFLDLRFGFSVTVLDPDFEIKDNSLEILSDTVLDRGLLTIEEFVFDPSFRGLGSKDAVVDPFFGDVRRADSIEFAAQRKVFVEKNIFLESASAMGFTELDMFEQRFSQVKLAPEPAGLLLLGAGLAFLHVLVAMRQRGPAADRR